MTTVRSTPIDVQARPTASRTTAPPAGRRFRDALGQSAQVVAQAVGTLGATPSRVTAPTVGSTSSNVSGARRAIGAARGALSGAETANGGGPGAPSSAMSAAEAAHAESSAEAMELLDLQRRISAEQVQFSTLSNVLKARHETAKSVVSNIR